MNLNICIQIKLFPNFLICLKHRAQEMWHLQDPRQSRVNSLIDNQEIPTVKGSFVLSGYFYCEPDLEENFFVSGAAAVWEMGAASQNPLSSNQGLWRKLFKINKREALLTLSLTNAALLVRGFFRNWDYWQIFSIIDLAGGGGQTYRDWIEQGSWMGRGGV
jgi:hypothetical protein